MGNVVGSDFPYMSSARRVHRNIPLSIPSAKTRVSAARVLLTTLRIVLELHHIGENFPYSNKQNQIATLQMASTIGHIIQRSITKHNKFQLIFAAQILKFEKDFVTLALPIFLFISNTCCTVALFIFLDTLVTSNNKSGRL